MNRLNNTFRVALLVGVAFGGIAVASGALAQTQSAPPPANAGSDVTTNVQELVVTANKRDERLHDVAMGITAVTGADLQTRQQLDFNDFAAQVPGFSLQQYGVGGWDREILRGQNSGGTGATVATVIDDMPLSFSGGDLDAGLTSTRPDTYDLRRVEVLKGPQGTLYGATAEGGVVKYVTNPPDVTGYHFGAELGGDTVAHGGNGGSGKGFLNVPFWDGKAALRFTGFYEDVPGYIDDPNLGTHDVNRGIRYGGRLSLLVKPTSDLSIRATYSHQELHSDGFGLEEAVGTQLVPSTSPSRYNLAAGYTFNTVLPQNDANEVGYYLIDTEYDLHWAKLSSLTSYGNVKDTFNRDFSIYSIAKGLNYGTYFGNAYYGHPIAMGVRQLENLNKFNQEFRISSEPDSSLFGLKIDWVGGVFLTRENSTFNQFYDFRTIPTATAASTLLTSPAGGGSHDPERFEEGALFGQIDYHLTPTLDVAVGGRVSWDQEQLHITTATGAISGVAQQAPLYRNEEQPTTWSVSPRWQVTNNTLAYLRFATGYRPGGPNLVPLNPPPGYNYYYQADSTMNYEGGVRTDFFHRMFTVDVAAFYIDWSNIQILSRFTATNGVAYGATGNAGTASSSGVEYNFGFNPVPGLTFQLLGSYTDAHLTSAATALGALKGQSLAYVPKWSNTINADYQWRVADGWKGFVGATAVFVGTRYTDFSTTVTLDPHSKLPDYNTLAVQGGLKHGPYTFEVYAKNLTDSQGIGYYTGANGFNNTGVVSLIQPRLVGFRVAVEY